jgi:allantoicase
VTLADLAAQRLGGMVLAASDEFFAPKERLLDPSPPRDRPGVSTTGMECASTTGRECASTTGRECAYTDRGKWMDGWETRRRRGPGHDWALIRLGVPGVVRAVVVDTSHFRGNQPAACSLDGLGAEAGEPAGAGPDADWHELLPRTPLEPDQEQRFAVEVPLRVSHVRLRIHPDGGVARLRVLGEPLPDLRRLAAPDGRADLAAALNGAEVVACSDMSFAAAGNLLLPGDALDMGDGWETRRRRDDGHDWAVVRLAAEGVIERVEVATTHYRGNYPERCELEACLRPDADRAEAPEDGWWTVVPSSRLGPHARHVFAAKGASQPASHVRLRIHPDGGVSRLRVWGRVSDDGWRRWGLRWLNALTPRRAEQELLACCGSRAWASAMAASRPFGTAQELAGAADKLWEGLDPDDWLEAFAAHPRIGERSASAWSTQEQSGVAGAEAAVLDALAEGNRAYEARFGHVFLVQASGRGAAELLAELRARLGNDPDAELRVAAAEQAKITRLRLDRLFRP